MSSESLVFGDRIFADLWHVGGGSSATAGLGIQLDDLGASVLLI